MGLAQTTAAGGKQTAVGKQPAQGKCQVADGAEGSWQEGAGYLAGARIPGLALDFSSSNAVEQQTTLVPRSTLVGNDSTKATNSERCYSCLILPLLLPVMSHI